MEDGCGDSGRRRGRRRQKTERVQGMPTGKEGTAGEDGKSEPLSTNYGLGARSQELGARS
jgi:hypothetical protein